jgi:hypothetical protein
MVCVHDVVTSNSIMFPKQDMKCRLCLVLGVSSRNKCYITCLSTDVVQIPVSNGASASELAGLFIHVDRTMELRMFFLLLIYTYVIASQEQQYVSKHETRCGQGF